MNFKSVWVLGSTSDVAVSICNELAKNGCKKFHLISRRKLDNEFLINNLKFYDGITINLQELDLLEIEDKSNIEIGEYDLYLITAGYLGDNNLAIYDKKESSKILRINFISLIPIIQNIIYNLDFTKETSLWVFSSVAADLGKPSNFIYGAAKSALNTYCEGLSHKFIKSKFKVRVIKAGYIDTKMSRGKTPSFLTIKPNLIAKHLLKSLKKSGVEYFPKWWKLIMIFVKLLPARIVSKL